MTSFKRLAFPLLAATLLNACAQRPAEPVAAPAEPAAEPMTPIYGPGTVADLLVAEVAAQRNALDVTMAYYADKARTIPDAEVARQAARLAAYLDDPALATEMGERWLAHSPDSLEARELLALSWIRQGNSEKAAAYIDELLAVDPRAALTGLVSDTRGAEQQTELLRALGRLSERYPDQAPLWYAKAVSLQLDGDLDAALAACNRALRANKLHEDALLLKARLMFDLGDQPGAIRHLQKLQRKFPEAVRVRITLARLLILAGREDDAAAALATLNAEFSDHQDMRYSLALLGLERGMHAPARATLEALLSEGYRPAEMHLFLGRALEDDNALEGAIAHYRAVKTGPHVLQAQLQAARLLFRLGQADAGSALMAELRDHFPERIPELLASEAELRASNDDAAGAMKLATEALIQFPDNRELLYTRAMVAERLDNLSQLEVDLRRLLELYPNDPVALNALGYTLADRTDRAEEALKLIQGAYLQQPDDPAIIDSMGWALYKLGRLDEAAEFLRSAWAQFPDHEVGAHYGEVLWQLGQQEAARKVWREALERHPDSEKVLEAVKRLSGNDAP